MAGQLIERGKNNYTLRVFSGRDGFRKRRYINRTFKGNKKKAQEVLHSMLHAGDLGALTEPTKTNLGEYLDEWLDTAPRPPVSVRPVQVPSCPLKKGYPGEASAQFPEKPKISRS